MIPPTQKPTQMPKKGCSTFGTQEIGPRSISFEIIFGALQSELFRFKFHSLGSKIQKIRNFNLFIIQVYEILAVSDGRVFIIMDYASKGDLLRYIQKE